VTAPPTDPFNEYQLVEQPAIKLFEELGWEAIDAYRETLGTDGTLGREDRREVVLVPRLQAALERLNPELPREAIQAAIAQLSRDRSVMHHVRANREVYEFVRDGVRVNVRAEDGSELPEVVQVIDWSTPEVNDFLLVSQLWIQSDFYTRRADLVGFVNGIPVVFAELKAAGRPVREAFDGNLTDYRSTIPQIFVPNGFIILSNGAESKIGTISSGWEHFGEWKRINSEGEHGIVSLDTMIRGTCEKSRLLDLLENFVAYSERPGGLVKLLARNHQYLGVNNAIERLEELRTAPPNERGRLGVFWHTQGSGKTLSMLLFSQKVLRKRPGNWTFAIVTDRTDLDNQAYEEFTDAGVLTEGHVQATSGEHLKTLLAEDHRYVFTLIQKFRTEHGETYPVISDRSDVVVITDEAHRSQYDVLALNMRNALPNASFLGFTGTPLMAGEERTREVFGDYVSKYDFGASIRDGATVPLYYENRIPELQLTNANFQADVAEIIDEAELDEAQEAKLARVLGRQYELITRADRIDRIAADIVAHFLGRGFAGKAMVVSIDKATAVRTYDRVRVQWMAHLDKKTARLAAPALEPWERDQIAAELAFMRETDMAVVVSQSQNEILTMQERGLDITPHRKRMVEENLEAKFKDPEDPLRIAFVCAMWTTGFDVPSCSTIYLDKPLKNHTLMQTIARANRVFPQKNNGLIVDYIGVFRDLQAALAIYAAPGAGDGDEVPVKDKDELVSWLKVSIDNATNFCRQHDVDLSLILDARGFERVALGQQAVEQLIADEATKQEFLSLARLVDRLFKSILPDVHANEFGPVRSVLMYLADAIGSLTPPADISGVLGRVEQLLDESVAANAYVIKDDAKSLVGAPIDLNQVNWESLEQQFRKGKKRTEMEKLRAAVAAKVSRLARLNPTRIDWVERFQKLIDAYNAGSVNVEDLFKELVELAKSLDEEARRALRENVDEEQLAIYDLLMRPGPDLTEAEKNEVKRVARSLLETLKQEKLVLDWRKEQRARAAVRLAVETKLDELPEKYDKTLYDEKCEAVYHHIFDCYWDDGHSIYDLAA